MPAIGGVTIIIIDYPRLDSMIDNIEYQPKYPYLYGVVVEEERARVKVQKSRCEQSGTNMFQEGGVKGERHSYILQKP